MEMLKDIRDIIETDIEPYKPGAAKALKFLLIPLAIAIVSILAGTVGSLIVRTFTDIGLKHMPFWIILHALITLVMYGLLHAIRAYQLYAGSGVAVDTIIVAIIFLAFNFEIKVQVGSWVSAIDSKAFALAALSIYCWDAWCDMGRAIKSWVKCREHIKTRFGV